MTADSMPSAPPPTHATANPNSLIALRQEFDAFKKTIVETWARELFEFRRRMDRIEDDMRLGRGRLDKIESSLRDLTELVGAARK